SGFKTFLVPPTQSLVYTASLEQVNLSEYALTNWDLNVVEVSNLDEVFEHFTGLVIERESVEGVDVVVDDYSFLMRFMASSLLGHVNKINLELHSKFDESNLSYAVSGELGFAINSSDLVLNNIFELFENDSFYVAASKSLQEAINARYAFYLIDYDLTVSKNVFVKSVLDSVNDEIQFFVNSTNYSLILDNVYDLELVVASLDRLREAESIILSAYESFQATDYRGALFLSATALERLETARTWLNTTNYLSGSESFVFNDSLLSALAISGINDASTAITYASTLVSDSAIFNLQQGLDGVSDFFVEGKYARTIFESLSLKAEANLLMEVRGLTDDLLSSLFSTKRDNVVRLIVREERSGELPILAISYLLYADYFFEVGDLSNALRYLNYAAQYSSLSSDVFKAMIGKPSSQVNNGFVLVNANEWLLDDDSVSFLFGMVFASIIFVFVFFVKLIIS
ncbi:MAG: hypothetical protein GON13_02350, partial [Nanoarchaeota archaeon]|nr:hypothetical protein [Nanoarchaeota archaeon]